MMTLFTLLFTAKANGHALTQSNRVLFVVTSVATTTVASKQSTAHHPNADSRLKLRLMASDLPPYVDGFADGLGVVPPLVQQALAPHFQVETTLTSWSTLLASAKAPRHLLLYWQRSVELEKEWYFSEPLLSQRYGFFYLASSPIAANAASLQRLGQLQDYRIGVLAGMHYGREFVRAQNLLKRVEFGSELAILQALQRGEIELALIDIVQAKQLINTQTQRKIQRLPQLSLTVDQLYLLCSRNYLPCHEILLQFQQGWRQLTTDGTLDTLFAIDAKGTT
jgi:ABC-type amino acid transport substrate-binding protein